MQLIIHPACLRLWNPEQTHTAGIQTRNFLLWGQSANPFKQEVIVAKHVLCGVL